MKNNRHNVIMSIIKNNKIRTHEQLVSELAKQGYNVTQATISRDIKVLGLTKFSDSQGSYYGVGKDKTSGIFAYSDYVIDVNYGGNMIVIKTRPGTASAIASTIDPMLENEILGSIAGDDTIFLALKTPEDADEIIDILNRTKVKI